jgi:transposase
MPKPYSADIRARVIARVEAGASRREAAEHFDISASAAVKWVKLFHETGSCAAKPFGGSTSPLEEYATFLLTLIAEQPDLTLDEVVAIMRKHKVPGKRTSVWRFSSGATRSRSKKKPAGGRTGAAGRGAGTQALEASAAHA